MRIAVIHSFYRSAVSSGENNTVLAQVEALRGAGHEVELIAQYTDENRKRNPLYPLKAGFDVATGNGYDPTPELEKFQPDVVWVHNLFPNFATQWLGNWKGPILASLYNYRSVCANGSLFRNGQPCTKCPDGQAWAGLRHRCYRNSFFASLPLVLQTSRHLQGNPIFQNAKKLIVISTDSWTKFRAFGAPVDRLTVLPSFIEVPERKLRHRPRNTRWLVAGRLSAEKGLVELVKIWPEEFLLDIYGDGPNFSQIQQCAGESVELKGIVSQDQLHSIMSQYRGLVFYSLAAETQGLIAAEAAALGLSTVALRGTIVGTALEAVDPRATFLSNTESLRKSLVHVSRNPNCEKIVPRLLWTRRQWLTSAEEILSEFAQTR